MEDASRADDRRIPLGIRDLDKDLNGGVRPGATILPIGQVGTGATEFARSCAIMHGNWQADSELFELEYGDFDEPLHRPDGVRYYTVTDSSERLRLQMEEIANVEWVETAFDNITVHSLAEDVADLGPIRVTEEGGFEYGEPETGSDPYQEFLETLGDHLSADLSNELVIIDSITDLLPMMYRYLSPTDIYFTAQTLCHRIESSGSALIAPADVDFLNQRERAFLQRPFDTVLRFKWHGEGGYQRRTIELTKFPEFWIENPTTERIVFDVELDRNRFGISSVEKIPPSKL
jgi:archaellum biogenesis ATPase FlaH